MRDVLAWTLLGQFPLAAASTLYLHLVARRLRPRLGIVDDWARVSLVLSGLSLAAAVLALGYLVDVPALALPGGIALGFLLVAAAAVPDYLAARVALLRWTRGLSLLPPQHDPDASDQLDP